mgnify:CR=1 FL=1
MKTRAIMIGLSLAVAACGGAPETADPYADLAENSLLVRFEANPDIAEGMCNPNVHYAMRTKEESILLNVNFEVGGDLTGAGLAIFDADKTGVARNTGEFNMFQAYPTPCSELQVRMQDLTCRLETEIDAQPCPNPVFEGTEMFASFRGLPDN